MRTNGSQQRNLSSQRRSGRHGWCPLRCDLVRQHQDNPDGPVRLSRDTTPVPCGSGTLSAGTGGQRGRPRPLLAESDALLSCSRTPERVPRPLLRGTVPFFRRPRGFAAVPGRLPPAPALLAWRRPKHHLVPSRSWPRPRRFLRAPDHSEAGHPNQGGVPRRSPDARAHFSRVCPRSETGPMRCSRLPCGYFWSRCGCYTRGWRCIAVRSSSRTIRRMMKRKPVRC